MNFQAYLENAYRIVKEEPFILILGGLIVQLLTLLSLGILAGPFMGGYTLLIILYLRENKKPSFNDIFSGLQQFALLFPYFLVLLLTILGFALFIVPGLLFLTWWLYVLPLMVDKKMPFTDAMRLSMNKVSEKGFLMHFVFVLLVYVIPLMLIEFTSTIIPFAQLLKLLLPAFQVGCTASLYIDQFPGAVPEPDAEKQEIKIEHPSITQTSADVNIPEADSEEGPEIAKQAGTGEATDEDKAETSARPDENTQNKPGSD